MSCRSPRCGCKSSPDNCCPPPPHKDKCCAAMLLCDNQTSGAVVPFVRIYQDDCTTDLTLNGAAYAVMGTVAQCTEDQTDGCDTTTPVTTVALCLADGTPIAVVIQRSCDGVMSAPGWINLTTGVYTAGAVPAGAAPCDSSVAMSTTGLTLLDGTPITVVTARDGDGVVTQAGWINATTGVFTAGLPPATVRAPGDAEPDLVVLCDTAANGTVTSFVRNFLRDRSGAVIGHTDRNLAGTAPYVPTGTVAACDATPPCDTTTPISTTGLCLADGTPIAVVSIRDCDGVITQTGWVRIATGAFTIGPPPAGTQACGAADVETQLLCVVDAGGQVLTQVVAEYGYNTGTGVRTFARYTDPTSGAAVAVPPGASVQACPGNRDVEVVKLCDVNQAVGVNLRFFRHYVYNPDGTLATSYDTNSAGAPYVPTGTGQFPCDQVDRVSETQILCDDNGPFVQVYALRPDILPELQAEAQASTFELTLAGEPYEPVGTVGVCQPTTTNTEVLCDVQPNGTSIQFLRRYVYSGTDGTPIATVDTSLNGTTPYAVTGTVALCEPAPDCESPTTPIATTGLCLADGTPIATVAQRDCDGVVTQAGWINATTGAFTAGLPPAGTRACGTSQSIQVSGVFCDINPADGSVFALVLVEYTYAPDGSIASVRLVRASDGTTYVLQGELGICPATGSGMDVETQLLCLVDAGGVLISPVVAEYGFATATGDRLFVRYTDPTTGAVIAPPVGATVTECAGCVDCTTTTLCDQPTTAAAPTVQQYADRTGLLTNGVTFWASPAATAVPGQQLWEWGGNGTLSFSAPVTATFDVHVAGTDMDALVILPAGVELVALAADHVWDATTRHLGPATAATPLTSVSTFKVTGATEFSIGRIGEPAAGQVGNLQVLALATTPFLRTVCRTCEGVVQSTVDTGLDGQTPYVVAGVAVACDPEPDTVRPCCPEPVCYAGSGPGEECAPGVLQLLPTIDPTIVAGTVEANPNGFTVSALSASYNGTTVGDWANLSTDGLAPISASPGVVIRYTFNAPTDIAQVLLYNNYGFVLNDADGFGSGTLTVYDAADVVLFTGPLAAGNGAPPFSTSFGGGVLEDAAYFEISDLASQVPNSVMGWREVQAVGRYRALITWECPDATISAIVEGVLAGVTYDGVTITQTNGPHTFTFSSSGGAFQANIVTDQPAVWSTLQVSDTQPVAVLSGDLTSAFAVRQVPGAVSGISAAMLWPDGTVTDANTGQPVVDPFLVPCVAVREPDHVVSADVVEMCESGHPFFRQIRVTRDQVVLITDTEIDGRTPYVVVSDVAVTAGPCTSLRLSDACAELGPQLEPSTLVGFTQMGDCLVTGAGDPSATWTGTIDSLEFSVVGTIAGGPSFRLLLDGATTVSASDFTPPIPGFPGTVGDEYSGTATVGGFTITAEVVNGSLSGGAGIGGTAFGLAGRMRFTFSPTLSSVAINTEGWGNDPSLQICDVVILPSPDPDPQPLAAYRDGAGQVTYYRVDGTVILDPVLLPCGECCVPDGGGAPFARTASTGGGPVRARGATVDAGTGPWLAADHVTGTLQSLSATGTAGTWQVTDAAGDVMTGLTAGTTVRWDTDGDELVAPAAITADAGGAVAVTWTEQ